MSDQDEHQREAAAAPYGVGYGKPPAEHRFRKGKSGNPRGRPRKKPPAVAPENAIVFSHQGANQLLLEEAYRPISVTENGKQVTMPMIQAVFRSIAVNAAKGNRFAQRTLASQLERIETDKREQKAEFFQMMIRHQSDAEYAIAEARRLGRPEPEILPHPADIRIDLATAEVRITGPFTPEQKVQFDELLAQRDELAELAGEARRACLAPGTDADLQERFERWRGLRAALHRLEKLLPPSYKERLNGA